MQSALHPVKNWKITVAEHVKEFGKRDLLDSERARCPVCRQRMNNISVSAPGSHGHFAHKRDSGFCPTKESAGAPYRNKPPRTPDPEAAIRMKAAFRLNWEKHFSRLSYLVKELNIKEFFEVLQLAKDARIWEYASLQEYQIPYILATLTDFPPWKSFGNKRTSYFRCWFDSSVRCYDDLWIHREHPPTFWRAWYAVGPKKGKPKINALIDSYGEEMSATFLERTVNLHGIVPIVVGKLDKYL